MGSAAAIQLIFFSIGLVCCVQAAPHHHYVSKQLVKRYVDANFTVEQVLQHLLDNPHITDRSSLYDERNKRQSATGLNCHSTDMYGGRGGGYFQDPCHPAIKRIDIGDHIDHSEFKDLRYIKVTYKNANNQDVVAPLHGASHETVLHRINLAEGEHIIAVIGRHTTGYRTGRIHQLGFLTRSSSGARQVFGPYGGEKGNLFVVNADVVSFFGRAGGAIDAIGFFYTP